MKYLWDGARPDFRVALVSETVPPPFPEGVGRSQSKSSKRTPERSSRRQSPSSDSSSSGSLGSEWDDINCDMGGGNPPKIPLFHGEPGEWPSFYFAFRQVANGMRLSNAQRKQRLLQSLRGKAAAYLLANPHTTHYSFRRLLKEMSRRFDAEEAPSAVRHQLLDARREGGETLDDSYMERTISFPPGEWPPLSQSSPAPGHSRRPVRRAAPTPPSRDEPPPGRSQKRCRHNRRPQASQGHPPTPPGEMGPPISPGGVSPVRRRRNRPGTAQRRRWKRNAGREAVEADPPMGAGPSLGARVPDALSLLLGLSEAESDLLQMVAPLLPLPSFPGRGNPPSGPEDAPVSGPPSEAPDPPSPNRGSPPPGREDASVGGPPPETLGVSQVDSHPSEAMETSVAGDPSVGISGPLSEEELVEIDSHMHLDRCFSKRHGFGCQGGRCQTCDNTS